MNEGQSSDGHADGIDMCLRFHSPLVDNGDSWHLLAPRLRPAFLDEMNISVRFRGAWHLCRGEGARGGAQGWARFLTNF